MTLPPPPAELEFLSSRMSREALLRLLDRHGGTRLYIAKTVTADMPLARELGMDAAAALALYRGGEYLKVPMAKAWRARCYQAQGASYPVIARRLGATEKAVWGWLSAAGMTNRQLGLFD
ncbi:hypothetical protein [Plastoroseomonas hellenica]|uniref:hypothetical protein n=1 Tax=Plastoroseomonas hellenica TaxID=2687306 RepID=UPI001BAB9909|nr:hypothetical protein [Plastoroseomonas hellenica]MBR0644008.1 helix-turn-helix domain-containing protein [Plastoroseomonas hellenica]